MSRIYSVYKGELDGELVYIGTTIQEPAARFRWHKANGKDLKFSVLFTYKCHKAMLAKEFELIQQFNPRLNKITHRRQNFNVKLTPAEVQARVGLAGWCQTCLKRRVNTGYEKCRWC
ncbi:hypothetical protein D3C80_1482000 [compost metagenome]